MSNQSPIGFLAVASMVIMGISSLKVLFFWHLLLLTYYYRPFKDMKPFWWLILFFIDEFFIFRLKSVTCTKYANGNDRKYINTVDIISIWLYSRLTEDCTVDCTVDCSVDCTVYGTVDCSLLRLFLLFFFISAAILWPWATRSGCFSHVIDFFSSSVIFT